MHCCRRVLAPRCARLPRHAWAAGWLLAPATQLLLPSGANSPCVHLKLDELTPGNQRPLRADEDWAGYAALTRPGGTGRGIV